MGHVRGGRLSSRALSAEQNATMGCAKQGKEGGPSDPAVSICSMRTVETICFTGWLSGQQEYMLYIKGPG